MDENIFNKYLDTVTQGISILPDKPEETPLNTLKALWLKAQGNSVSVFIAGDIQLENLTDEQTDILDGLIKKRLEGVPLAHITGRQSFMGLEMLAGPEALIPRKETEILANAALDALKQINVANTNIIDVCTGAGNIALVMANANKNAKVYASDLSEDAVCLAAKNAEFLNMVSQVEFYSGDLLEPFNDLDLYNKINLLTCNPPYISTSKVTEMPSEISEFEPSLAFDGGSFGINLIRRLITDAEKFLCTDGFLVFEVGLGQGEIIKKQVQKTSLYKNINIMNDELGQPRVISAQKI